MRQPGILEPTQTSRSVLRGLVVLRWGTWLWAAIATVLGDDRLARPWLAVALLAAALAVNVAATVERRLPSAVELVVGVIAAGITLGPWPAAIGGALVGAGRIVGVEANGVDELDATPIASLASTMAFYALYGAAAGWVGTLLRCAEREVGAARAREEVARTLHDGVLQTLAVVERRLGDREPEVARLVRDTERELRLSIETPLEGGTSAPRSDVPWRVVRATTQTGVGDSRGRDSRRGRGSSGRGARRSSGSRGSPNLCCTSAWTASGPSWRRSACFSPWMSGSAGTPSATAGRGTASRCRPTSAPAIPTPGRPRCA